MGRFVMDTAQIRAASRQAARQELRIGGLLVQNRAKILCPVDTGRLRSSIRLSEEALEFSVSSNVVYAPMVHDGTAPHVIRPRRRRALRFRVGGRTVFATRVNHPGTRPRPFLLRALIEVGRARGWELRISRVP